MRWSKLNQQDQNHGLFDTRTLVAILAMVLFWVAWQFYMDAKYPKKKATAPSVSQEVQTPADAPKATAPAVEVPGVAAAVSNVEKTERLFAYEDDNFQLQVNSQGMGIKEATLKQYSNREKQPIRLGHPQIGSLFSTLD